jgi:hypothetical protein
MACLAFAAGPGQMQAGSVNIDSALRWDSIEAPSIANGRLFCPMVGGSRHFESYSVIVNSVDLDEESGRFRGPIERFALESTTVNQMCSGDPAGLGLWVCAGRNVHLVRSEEPSRPRSLGVRRLFGSERVIVSGPVLAYGKRRYVLGFQLNWDPSGKEQKSLGDYGYQVSDTMEAINRLAVKNRDKVDLLPCYLASFEVDQGRFVRLERYGPYLFEDQGEPTPRIRFASIDEEGLIFGGSNRVSFAIDCRSGRHGEQGTSFAKKLHSHCAIDQGFYVVLNDAGALMLLHPAVLLDPREPLLKTVAVEE